MMTTTAANDNHESKKINKQIVYFVSAVCPVTDIIVCRWLFISCRFSLLCPCAPSKQQKYAGIVGVYLLRIDASATILMKDANSFLRFNKYWLALDASRLVRCLVHEFNAMPSVCVCVCVSSNEMKAARTPRKREKS